MKYKKSQVNAKWIINFADTKLNQQENNIKEMNGYELQAMVWCKTLDMQMSEITRYLEHTSRNWDLENELLDEKPNPVGDKTNSQEKSDPNSNIRCDPQLDDNQLTSNPKDNSESENGRAPSAIKSSECDPNLLGEALHTE